MHCIHLPTSCTYINTIIMYIILIIYIITNITTSE